MKKAVMTIKRGFALILATAVTAVTLSGCGYASFDDYLKALGIKDPMEYDDIFEAASVEDIADVATAPEEVPAEEAEQEAEEISFDIGTLESSEEEETATVDLSQAEPADLSLEAKYKEHMKSAHNGA